MAYECRIECDSINDKGIRLTTFVVTFPRIILAEFNTHRVFSRNSASSRAIPVRKQIRAVLDDPFIPAEFGTDQPGMQAGTPLGKDKYEIAKNIWLQQRDKAVHGALELMTSPNYVSEKMSELDGDLVAAATQICDEYVDKDSNVRKREDLLTVSKGLANRLLEPFMWHTVVVTSTEWSNFFALRANLMAQLEIRTAAEMMLELYKSQQPTPLKKGEWHLPFIKPGELKWVHDNKLDAVKVSSGRSARVSYMTHDGKRDYEEDIKLYNRLASAGHMSPAEHVATPSGDSKFHGNFRGWMQHRKQLPNEQDFSLTSS